MHRLRTGWGFVAVMCLGVGCGGGMDKPPTSTGGSGGTGASGGSGGSGGSGETGGAGGGGGDASSETPAPVQRSVRVLSAPVKTVMAGEAMRYRVVVSD